MLRGLPAFSTTPFRATKGEVDDEQLALGFNTGLIQASRIKLIAWEWFEQRTVEMPKLRTLRWGRGLALFAELTLAVIVV